MCPERSAMVGCRQRRAGYGAGRSEGGKTGGAGLHGTCPTRVLVEFDNDGATALPTPMLPPRDRQVALGAAHLLLVPVHRKLLHSVSALDLCLPPLAGACGAPQGDA